MFSVRPSSFASFRFLLVLAVGLVLAPLLPDGTLHAQTPSPNTISQQGLLTDDAGNPLNGTFNMTFELGKERPDGSVEYIFSETQDVEVTNGRYNVRIGDDTQFPSDTFFPSEIYFPNELYFPSETFFPNDLYLRTTVEGETLTPRRALSSTPYARLAGGLFRAGNLPILSDGNVSLHVNNDASGSAGRFALFRGDGTTPFLEVRENSEGTPGMLVNGNFVVQGGTKDFVIQHPTKEGKKLHHHAVESNEVLNTYSGNVTLGADGTAVVEMPEWFGLINKDPRYTLTPIGAAAPRLHVAEPLSDGTFRIGGGTPGMRVSWQVTAVRDDPAVRRHKGPTVRDKRE
jgi:hypothetical protein